MQEQQSVDSIDENDVNSSVVDRRLKKKWVGKPVKNKLLFRKRLKKVYKDQKAEDSRAIGKDINEQIQALHQQYKLPKEKRDADLIKGTLGLLKELRATVRFKHDFPTFAHFYRYVKAENIPLSDLE